MDTVSFISTHGQLSISSSGTVRKLIARLLTTSALGLTLYHTPNAARAIRAYIEAADMSDNPDLHLHDDELLALLARLFPEVTRHKLLTGEDSFYQPVYTSALAIAEKRRLKIPHLELKDETDEHSEPESP